MAAGTARDTSRRGRCCPWCTAHSAVARGWREEGALLHSRGGRSGPDALLEALVLRARQGDRAAFAQLYLWTRRDAARALQRLVGPHAEVQDLLQEVYLRLLEALPRFRGEAHFRTFLHGVCIHVALAHLRHKRRRPGDVPVSWTEGAWTEGAWTEVPWMGHGPQEQAEHRQEVRLLAAALEQLSAKKRTVLLYSALCGMGPGEIAREVGSRPNTVRSRLRHARQELGLRLRRLLTSRPRR